MGYIEQYNKYYKGRQFTVDDSTIFTYGEVVGYNNVVIRWDGIRNSVYDIVEVFDNIENGTWVLSIVDERKKKLEHLLNKN